MPKAVIAARAICELVNADDEDIEQIATVFETVAKILRARRRLEIIVQAK